MVAGVCGGIAEHYDLDPNVVRIAVVLLTVFVGVGAVLYLAGWVLLPEDGNDTSPAAAAGLRAGAHRTPTDGCDPDGDRRRSTLTVALVVVGAIIVLLAAGGPWWIGHDWHPGLGVGWIVVGVLAYLILRPHRARIPFGRIIGTLVAVALGIAVLALSATLVAEALTGVPLRGGIGSHDFRPTTPAQVRSTYRVAVGAMTVDLRQVDLPDRPTTVTASVGVGRLLVEVPPGVSVSLSARSGLGNVAYGPGGQSAFVNPGGTPSAFVARAAHQQLILDADVGIGQVQLVRAAPGASVDIGDSGSPNPPNAPNQPASPTAPTSPTSPTGPSS